MTVLTKDRKRLDSGTLNSYFIAAQIASVSLILLVETVTLAKVYFRIKRYHFIILSFVDICSDSEWPYPLSSACIFNKCTSTDVCVRGLQAWLVASYVD